MVLPLTTHVQIEGTSMRAKNMIEPRNTSFVFSLQVTILHN